ncbi:MAG: glycosyltransferase [Deltaproteobacteria bacterium RBG_19FT_COMBO_43_11]|nr:MAG: glycosyltransferase [Deltaproteobacteria bacterium RBG_19FT_COMBO_43_11]
MLHKTSSDGFHVSVIIVNWNTDAQLKRCMLSLSKQTMPPREVIIVDNASTDSSAEGLEECYQNIKVVRLNNNIGFAAANNYAARLVSEECNWLALLNPDAFPEPTWLESLMDAVKHHPEYAFFGSLLLDANEPAILDGTGDVNHISGLVWREGHGQAVDASSLRMKEIFSPCAAAALYRKDIFAEANGFDEDYFCYVEDVDLGFRLRLLGYRCLYVPDAVAYHIGSAATGKRSDFSVYHGHRNLVWTYVKNMPGVLFWLLLPLHIALNLVIIIWFSLQGQGAVILKAKWDALCGIPRMWKKRRDIQRNRSASIGKIWQVLDKSFLPRLSQLRPRWL